MITSYRPIVFALLANLHYVIIVTVLTLSLNRNIQPLAVLLDGSQFFQRYDHDSRKRVECYASMTMSRSGQMEGVATENRSVSF